MPDQPGLPFDDQPAAPAPTWVVTRLESAADTYPFLRRLLLEAVEAILAVEDTQALKEAALIAQAQTATCQRCGHRWTYATIAP